MKINKYRAATMREALNLVKQDLGPEAVILKTTELKGAFRTGNDKVEVTAALDDDLPPPRPAAAQPAKSIPTASATASVPISPDLERTTREFIALRDDLKHLREEVRSGLRVRQESVPSELAPLAATLAEASIPADLVQDILAELVLCTSPEERTGDALISAARKVIATRVKIALVTPPKANRPIIALFLGPTGVGKSTSIAKLAGREVLQGHRKVAILTTDCYRMGALEQMQSFSAAAEVQLETVFGVNDIQGAMERLRDHDLVLVDTAGRSRGNLEHWEELKELAATLHPDETHLVLSCNTRDRDLLETVERFQPMGVDRILFTKQDETSELGSLLWLPWRTQLPVSFVCTGQRIPDDLELADRVNITKWLL